MSDLGNANWSETDASNNAASPNGWTTATMLPNQVEPTARAMMGALKRWYGKINPTYTTGGTTTAYTVTSTAAEAAYYANQIYVVTFNATCGASPTLNFDGLGAVPIRKFSNGAYTACTSGDIKANQIVAMKYTSGTPGNFDIVWIGFSYTDFISAAANNTFTGTNTFTGNLTATAGTNAFTGTIGSASVATTQNPLDNSTKVATTAYADSNLIQIVKTAATSTATLTGTYPTTSGAAPTNSGGTAITGLATTFTPKSASSVLEIEVILRGAPGGTDGFTLALFNSSTLVDFVQAFRSSAAGVGDSVTLKTWLASPGTSSLSFSARVGANSGTSWGQNQTNSGAGLITQTGSTCWLTIKEILPHP